MKIYVVVKDDHGYLGYGRDIGSGFEIESVHKSYEDAWFSIHGKYKNLNNIMNPDELKTIYPLVGWFRYFDENNDHAYEISIYEKEIEES